MGREEKMSWGYLLTLPKQNKNNEKKTRMDFLLVSDKNKSCNEYYIIQKCFGSVLVFYFTVYSTTRARLFTFYFVFWCLGCLRYLYLRHVKSQSIDYRDIQDVSVG